ncbi:golgin subfamily B member 1-like protein [Babesia caballi]|uniref:Golgin subfamily B member 1-like protein n=1 Tax=Babesia caballi TaxID=5871 RepID=A0AAV4LQ71_BABCB|nr:golgin subfamily B member 1-like protein [Babesia caballi]
MCTEDRDYLGSWLSKDDSEFTMQRFTKADTGTSCSREGVDYEPMPRTPSLGANSATGDDGSVGSDGSKPIEDDLSTAATRRPPGAFDHVRDALSYVNCLEAPTSLEAANSGNRILETNISNAKATFELPRRVPGARACRPSQYQRTRSYTNSLESTHEGYQDESPGRNRRAQESDDGRLSDAASSGAPDGPHLESFKAGHLESTAVSNAQSAFVAQLDLRITDYFTLARCIDSHVVYTLRFNDFGVDKLVTRRFSDFCLYDCVLRGTGYVPPIPLPEKRFWDNMDPSFLSQRFQALKSYTAQQLRHPQNVQLYLLHMFLGCSLESILYLHLVTAHTQAEKMNAVSLLFKYLMRPADARAAFLSSAVRYPLTSFTHLPPAKDDHCTAQASPDDRRLTDPLVMDSLLECLVFGDAKSVYEVCTILLWMLRHRDELGESAISLKAISYVTTAVSRLLVHKQPFDLAGFYRHARGLRNLRLLTATGDERDGACNLVSYFLVAAINLLPSAAGHFLDKSTVDNLINLVDLPDLGTIRIFALWVLWFGICEDSLREGVDRAAVNLLLKKLYSSEDTTLKALCGLVLVSLLSRGWFDSESAPRAAVSVANLLPSMHDLNTIVCEQVFSHSSMARFALLLGDTSLSPDLHLFLVSLLRHHLTSSVEPSHPETSLSALCTVDYRDDVSRLAHALFGPDDPDYRSDIAHGNDLAFSEKLAPLYMHRYIHIAAETSETLHQLLETLSHCAATPADEDESTAEDAQRLRQTAAVCLLFLPYHAAHTGGEGGDYFDVDFDPQSLTAHYRNVVQLRGGARSLHLDNAEHINLGDTVALRLDDQFFKRRLAVLQAIVSGLQESATDFESLHLSKNETTNDCMTLLRRLWSARNTTEHTEDPNTVVRFEAQRTEPFDLFSNFEFEGFKRPPLDAASGFHTADALELCSYASEMVRYGSVQQQLLRAVNLAILYHRTCGSRLATYRSMVTCVQRSVAAIQLEALHDLGALEDRFLAEIRAHESGLQEEGDLVASVQEKTAMLSRVQIMLRNTNIKLDASKRQVSAAQQRINDVPRQRQKSATAKKRLTQLIQSLRESIRAGNAQILDLQNTIARNERLKREYSACIEQLTHLSAVLDQGSYTETLRLLHTLDSDAVRAELQEAFDAIISTQVTAEALDEEMVLKLKDVVMRRLHDVQARFHELYAQDNNLQIAALNRKVTRDEEQLYRAQAQLQSAQKALSLDPRVLEESLQTQQLVMDNLEAIVGNLTAELARLNAGNLQLDKQFSEVRTRNALLLSQLQLTRSEFVGSVEKQRHVRTALLTQVMGAEFLCKKLWQERRKLARVLSLKSDVVDLLCERQAAERAARLRLVVKVALPGPDGRQAAGDVLNHALRGHRVHQDREGGEDRDLHERGLLAAERLRDRAREDLDVLVVEEVLGKGVPPLVRHEVGPLVARATHEAQHGLAVGRLLVQVLFRDVGQPGDVPRRHLPGGDFEEAPLMLERLGHFLRAEGQLEALPQLQGVLLAAGQKRPDVGRRFGLRERLYLEDVERLRRVGVQERFDGWNRGDLDDEGHDGRQLSQVSKAVLEHRFQHEPDGNQPANDDRHFSIIFPDGPLQHMGQRPAHHRVLLDGSYPRNGVDGVG